MTNQEFLGEFLSLPTEAQNQVVSLIAYLKQKYIYSESLSVLPDVDLNNDGFIGMWQDRQDLANANWVRNLRETEWSKTHD
ncbi:hypothetical protein MEO94_28820 [Dolichospermum sp. ST_sed9]|jgi:hypothetical protein|nr:hypothetical protein [Dolichospermum sp. ST_sed9]